MIKFEERKPPYLEDLTEEQNEIKQLKEELEVYEEEKNMYKLESESLKQELEKIKDMIESHDGSDHNARQIFDDIEKELLNDGYEWKEGTKKLNEALRNNHGL